MARETDYEFVSADAETIVSAMVAEYESLTGTVVQPSSPEKLFIQWAASIIAQERAYANYIGNQNLPSRAEGENLDALGELFFGVSRPAATAATTTIRFTLSGTMTTAVLIPAGTRVTDASAKLYWATDEDAYVPIGQLSLAVAATCLTVGSAGNGYAAGQISSIVDPFAYFGSCTNVTESAGGSDEATDDEYYETMREAMDAITTAGPTGSYIYHAKKVSSTIADVAAVLPSVAATAALDVYENSGSKKAFIGGEYADAATLKVYPHGSSTEAVKGTDYTVTQSGGLVTIAIADTGALASQTQIDVAYTETKAGHVYIYTLMDDGTPAGAEIKAKVLEACNRDEVRPLTDVVSCHDPEAAAYDISITYYVQRGMTKSQTELTAEVAAAVEEYKEWQHARLGRDINPDKLRQLLLATGIKRVTVASPAFTALKDGGDGSVPQYASCGTTTIVNGGYEDE